MTTDALRAVLLGLGQKIFAVTFTKKDGTIRDMAARLDVRSYQKNPDAPPDLALLEQDTRHGLLRVFDMRKKGYRMINLDGLQSIKCGTVEWEKETPDASN